MKKSKRDPFMYMRSSKIYNFTKNYIVLPIIVAFLFPLLLPHNVISHGKIVLGLINVSYKGSECNYALDYGINLTKPKVIDRKANKEFLSCVLDVSPTQKFSEYVVITDSLCPLGMAFADKLRQNGVPLLEIRGKNHLDFSRISSLNVMQQFHINSFFHVCKGNNNLSLYNTFITDELITVVNAIDDRKVKADIYVDFPRVFGNVRGKKSDNLMDNWFFECQNGKKMTKPYQNIEETYALATDVADRLVDLAISIRSHDEQDGNITFDVKTYTKMEIYEMMDKACKKEGNYSKVVRQMIDDSKPHVPTDRSLTLSIVGCVSTGTRFLERFQTVLYAYAHVLENYPKLPMEFIIVYTDAIKPLEEVVDIPEIMKQYIRVLSIDPPGVEFIKKKTKNLYFPEFAMKNIGARRARGEYIIAVNFDAIVQPDVLFDFVLHGQFTYLTCFRTKRLNVPLQDYLNVLDNISHATLAGSQYFVNKPTRESLVLDSSGDFEGAHWRMWERVHGFVEKKYTFHVDSVFLFDLYSQATPLLMKIISYDYHLMHFKTSNGTDFFPLHNKRFHRNINKGIPSHITKWKRDDWGFPDLTL